MAAQIKTENEWALFPYQVTGAEFLSQRRFAYLADVMGLGKSAQAITACDLVNAKRIVVVCLAVARENWRREFEQFATQKRPCAVMLSGKDKPEPEGVTIVSYDLLLQPTVMERLKALGSFVLICDESHSLKGRRTRRTKALLGEPSRKRKGLVDYATHWWCLSGTPAPNEPSELWTILRKAGVYRGDYWSYVDRFCTGFDDGFKFRITGAKNITALRELMAPYLLRRRKDEVMKELPPLTYSYLTVEPGTVDTDVWFPWAAYGDQRQIYRDLKAQGQAVTAVLNTAEGADNKLAAIQSLKGTPTGLLRRFVGLAKVDPIVETVTNELQQDPDKKIVLFCVHRDAMEDLKMKLKAFNPVRIYGGTPAAKRQRFIDRFQNNPKCRIFIGQMVAAGTSVNLTAASDVLIVEPDWVPGNNAQAIMRVHRIGQDKSVRVRFVRCKGAAVDEKVVELLKRKVQDLTALFD